MELLHTAKTEMLKMRRQYETRKLRNRKDDRAMRPICRCPENFAQSLTTPTSPCLRNF